VRQPVSLQKFLGLLANHVAGHKKESLLKRIPRASDW
jgi:hypothetical protein